VSFVGENRKRGKNSGKVLKKNKKGGRERVETKRVEFKSVKIQNVHK
jgi:hypothetical protein